MQIKQKNLQIIIFILSAIILAGCGAKTAVENEVAIDTASPATQEEVIKPAPTPFEEPETAIIGPVTFDAKDLESGLLLSDGRQCVSLREAADALGGEIIENEDSFIFSWYRGSLELSRDDYIPFKEGHDLLVDVESFCEACDIGMLYDEEYSHLYCTAAAGDWEIPQGYTCPVMMYHSVAEKNSAGQSTLCVKPERLEEQFKYLTENGYTPIWFEDIERIADIEKPVILMFDDGWADNYTDLWPLVEKYKVKVSICPVPVYTDVSHHHLTSDMIYEMCKSEYIRFESHTYSHEYLDLKTVGEQYDELVDSRLWITRMTSRQPIVLCYPTGIETDYVMRLINEDHIYRFGVKMLGMRSYNTSDNPAYVYRFYPERTTTIEEYSGWLELSFGISG